MSDAYYKFIALCGSPNFEDIIDSIASLLRTSGYVVLGPELISTDISNVKVIEPATTTLMRRIDLADEVVVVNPYGYIDEWTRQEINYANKIGKTVHYLYQKEETND